MSPIYKAILILMIVIVFSNDTAFDASDPRLPSDVWELIITDWMDTKSLRHISKVDSTRRSIVLKSGKTTIIRLKNMMKDYREKYDSLTKVKETTGMSESMINAEQMPAVHIFARGIGQRVCS